MKNTRFFLIAAIVAALLGAGWWGAEVYIEKRVKDFVAGLPAITASDADLRISSASYRHLDSSLLRRGGSMQGLELQATALSGPFRGDNFNLRANSLDISGAGAERIADASLSGLEIFRNGQPFARADSLKLTGIVLPDENFFTNLNAANLAARLAGLPEPLFADCAISGAALFMSAQATPDINAARLNINWPSSQPMVCQLSAGGISLPAAVAERELGFTLPHLRFLRGSADFGINAAQDSAGGEGAQISGAVRIEDLCSFDLGFRVANISDFSWLSLLRSARFSHVRVNYEDQGLLPCLARAILPFAEAAGMALKVAAGQLISSRDGKAAAMRSDLEAFIDRPGRISLESRDSFSLGGLLLRASQGRLDSLLSISASPGEESLARRMEETAPQPR